MGKISRIVGKLKRYAVYIANYLGVIESFLLGRCSYEKMKAFIQSYTRYLFAHGTNFNISTYNGKRILTLEEANDMIGKAIEAGKPFMAGRYGAVELRATWKVRNGNKGFIYPYRSSLMSLCENAGFFPEDKDLMIKFSELMRWSTYRANLMAVCFNPMEEWMLKTYGNNPEYCELHSIDPFLAPNPWSAKLEGKKVLVIHPFEQTIKSQYQKRELLFPNRNVLPSFNLRVVKAVQTILGNQDERFATWFDALDYMYNEAMKEDFDVAIIGCGAYGFPLAAKLKEAGKIAIHMGGVTQLLFGIKGTRWEKVYKNGYEELCRNEHWVRASASERPKRFDTLEIQGGAYW